MTQETKILLIGKKKGGKIIAEITDINYKSLIMAVGRSRNELTHLLRYHMNGGVTISEKPFVTNGFRVSQSTGEYIPCKKVPEDLEKEIMNIVFPKNEINEILEKHTDI